MAWVTYYLEQQRITAGCAAAWQAAMKAYAQAVVTGNYQLYITARQEALAFHAPTGDCQSDLIELDFNKFSIMSDSQLKRIVAREVSTLYGKQAALELAVRGKKESGQPR